MFIGLARGGQRSNQFIFKGVLGDDGEPFRFLNGETIPADRFPPRPIRTVDDDDETYSLDVSLWIDRCKNFVKGVQQREREEATRPKTVSKDGENKSPAPPDEATRIETHTDVQPPLSPLVDGSDEEIAAVDGSEATYSGDRINSDSKGKKRGIEGVGSDSDSDGEFRNEKFKNKNDD